jgi:hypothetical protein
VTPKQLRGTFWPTPQQDILLRIALRDDDEAVAAWRSLRPSFEIEKLEPGSYDLMPLLYRRLAELAPGDPVLGKLRGIYRRTWYANSLALAAVVPAVARLGERGLEPIVIGGWELVCGYYADLGLRPVSGIHLLVARDRIGDAEAALAADGWQVRRPERASLPRHEFSIRLVRGDAECVLHRQLFHEFVVPLTGSAPLNVWADAIEVKLDKVQARALAPADEFLNICVSGARGRSWPNARWPADAVAVARWSDGFDWQRVLEHARLLRATLRLRDALEYVSEIVPSLVPADVLAELRADDANRRERLAHEMSGRRGGRWGTAPESVARYLRVSAEENSIRAITRFPSFLRDEWGLRHAGYVPLVVAAKIGGRIALPLMHAGRGARARLTGGRRIAAARR